ncbi:hypothetical protein [Nonomuraea longispora]|uniref:hypothetical protein n=1 Tax=Nonomuraea longispora TaxID=1848320 RepID=UPI001FE936AD|nr:hypothetical protein [Nonomuraea longispora]
MAGTRRRAAGLLVLLMVGAALALALISGRALAASPTATPTPTPTATPSTSAAAPAQDCGFISVACEARQAVNEWFTHLVETASKPVFEMLGSTVLATPELDSPAMARAKQLWEISRTRWFDEHFQPEEKRRSYARASRRQASSPGIPRPGWVRPEDVVRRRTFGVVLDTSGSMDVRLLGKALGAIASYAAARDVPQARVVFCDAAAYDAGYLPVEEIAGRVRVRGRGGTVLQPGVRLLERAGDFPPDGPVLVITDGQCDVLRIRREHAFLLPQGASLPFRARRPVFYLK